MGEELVNQEQIKRFRNTARQFVDVTNRFHYMGERARENDPKGYARYMRMIPTINKNLIDAQKIAAGINRGYHVERAANLSGLGFVWFTWPVAAAASAAIAAVSGALAWWGTKTGETAAILDARQRAIEAGQNPDLVAPLPDTEKQDMDLSSMVKWLAIGAGIILILPYLKGSK